LLFPCKVKTKGSVVPVAMDPIFLTTAGVVGFVAAVNGIIGLCERVGTGYVQSFLRSKSVR
jgi:hypothetical protein